MHKYFSGITLIAFGVLSLLQMNGVYNFGLAFWPAVILYIGLEIVWGSLLDRHGPSGTGAAIGALVGGYGLMQILANAGVAAAVPPREWLGLAWPVVLVTIGLSLMFGRRRWHCC